jgi:signal transduction histidine kinase
MKTERMDSLLEWIAHLSAVTDFDAYLQAIVEAARALTSSPSASVLRFDAPSNTLTFAAASSGQLEFLRQIQIPLEGSAAGWTFCNTEPLVIQNTADDLRHFKEVDKLTGSLTRSLLAAPMMSGGVPIGVLEVINKTDAPYDDEDTVIVITLAALAVFAFRERKLALEVDHTRTEVASLDRMKSDFIAITSHELRTPLGLILGHATFLRELVAKQYHEQLDTIIRNATRLKEIVENLSSVENYQSGAARVHQNQVSMKRLVQEAAESNQVEARRKGVRIHVEVGAGSLVVEGEAGKIEIALNNLIKNAITFTDRGGNIFVKTDAVPGYVKVSIIDDGIGIPAADLLRVFDRFYQVESHLTRKHGGMGLGLSVAKAMIELHGGRIWAESVEGHGSNFTFLLPIDASQASAAEKVFLS